MPLSETELLILKANRIYKTTEQKVDYVNIKLRYVDSQGQVKKEFESRAMTKSRFYSKLGNITKRTRTRERFFETGKGFLFDLVETEQLYQGISNDTERDIENAVAEDKIFLANSLRKTLIDLQPQMMALREDIRELAEEGEVEKFDEPSIDPLAPFRESQEGEGEARALLQEPSRKTKTHKT